MEQVSVELNLFYRFGVALFIGILVGLQREYVGDVREISESRAEMFAGVRTFALMALAGCTAAMLADLLGSPWVFIGIILPLGLLITVGYFVTAWRSDAGMTTEFAAISTILAGALAYQGELVLAVALGVTITILLSLKLEMQRFVAHLTREDILAALKFGVITAIVLPVLPNQTFGPPPFNIFNPYQIWLIVVLISGISFLGYLLMKLVDPQQGISLTGILGGLASSTATTLSFAQRSHKNPAFARSFSLAILAAWTVMFGRALVEIGAVNFALFRVVLVPMAITAAAGLLYGIYLYFSASREEDQESVELSNPFELRPAIQFGLIYAVILFVSRAGQHYFGETGIYVSSLVAGLADVDAIALSIADLSSQPDGPTLTTAARAVVIAALANTFAKGGIVAATGSAALRRAILPGMLLILAAGIGVILMI